MTGNFTVMAAVIVPVLGTTVLGMLNADYAATTVPVPDGTGPQEKGVRLVE